MVKWCGPNGLRRNGGGIASPESLNPFEEKLQSLIHEAFAGGSGDQKSKSFLNGT
ncbi:MAG TPA: hypothetical protein VIK39_07505 [Candidatus Angelobacter sp.]